MTTAAYSDRDVEKIAWAVLLGTFTVFMLLLIGVPLAGFWYLSTATDAHESSLTVLSGTVIVDLPGRGPTGEQKSLMVLEGATIRTDANTRVNLALFDGSTVIVFPDTQVIVSRVRSPKFPISPQPLQAQFDLRNGRLRLDVAKSDRPLDLKVLTPQGESQFQPGNYRIEVGGDQTDVIVRRGHAVVKAHNEMITLRDHERSVAKVGEAPNGPFTAERDLITNGTFTASLAESWRVYNDQGDDGGNVNGTAQVEIDQGQSRRLIHFVRRGSGGNHDDTGIEQPLDIDVTDAEVIRFRGDVRVNFQSLAGGGNVSSEFPLMIKIKYRDIKGGERIWVHGFYYQNVDGKAIVNGELIPQGLWYPYESEDLTDSLDPKPARILSIQIYASGWDFDSMVSDVGLTVE